MRLTTRRYLKRWTSGQQQKTKKRSVICDPWEVVVVPFPFTERAAAKRRPALILSKKSFNQSGHSVMAMITTTMHQPWPGDTNLSGYRDAGLRVACAVRLKIFTLDNRLILKKTGNLSAADRNNIRRSLQANLA